MGKKLLREFGVLVFGIAAISLCGCATCKTSYRRELSDDHRLEKASLSYRKAIKWLDKAECSLAPAEAEKFYTTAESYISDAIYKLEEIGHDKNVDVSDDVYYCEKIKRETDVKIGKSERSPS